MTHQVWHPPPHNIGRWVQISLRSIGLSPTSTTQQEEEQALERLQTTVREEVSTTYFRNDDVALLLQDILMTLL